MEHVAAKIGADQKAGVTRIIFDKSGLRVWNELTDRASGAEISFEPKIDGEPARYARRDHISSIGVGGIRALQDYVILVDAGIFPRPGKITGLTNRAMIAVAKNFGFNEVLGNDYLNVEASFAAMSQAAFSDHTLKLETILAGRLARQEPGPFEPDQKVLEAAAAKGIALDMERLRWLSKTAARLGDRLKKGQRTEFHKDGLYIGYPVEIWRGNPTPTYQSTINFKPVVDSEEVVISTREHMSSFGLLGIRALQDYVILTEAGYLKKPDTASANTNPAMARISKRFGFEVFGEYVKRVTATYEALAQAAF